ncbi:MAG: hypothetical protein ABIH82_05115, partial [Candidatus Woesearchaeota archaeon]
VKTGARKEVQSEVFFNEKTFTPHEINNLVENSEACQDLSKRALNTAYLCDGQIIYTVTKPSGPFKFTITSWRKDQESSIANWKSI